MYKVFIFDCDGVIIPSVDFHKKIWEQILGEEISYEFFAQCHEGNIYQTRNLLGENYGLEKLQKGFVNYFNLIKGVYPNISIEEDVREMLSLLDTLNIPQVIVSSGEEILIEQNFRNNHIHDFFHKKIYGKQTDKSKVKKLEMVCRDFDVKPEECLFFTDTLGDVLEGNEVGIPTYGVGWCGLHNEETLKRGRIEGFFKTPQELFNAFYM